MMPGISQKTGQDVFMGILRKNNVDGISSICFTKLNKYRL